MKLNYLHAVFCCHCHTELILNCVSETFHPTDSPASQTRVARKACGGSRDMAVPNLFWRNVEVVSAPPPLYLNFYRKFAMIAKLLNLVLERVADTHRNFYLWLRRAIPSNLLMVIDRRNICAAEQIWYRHVPRPITSVEDW